MVSFTFCRKFSENQIGRIRETICYSGWYDQHPLKLRNAMNDQSNAESAIQADELSTDELFPVVYDELRKLAQYHVRRQRVGDSLSATGLVHEAFFKLVRPASRSCWDLSLIHI